MFIRGKYFQSCEIKAGTERHSCYIRLDSKYFSVLKLIFHASLIIISKAGAYQSRAHENIRLAHPKTNT